MGRPSIYSEEITDDLCEQLAQGKTLGQVCEAERMPSLRSVYSWLETNEDFLHKYTRARGRQAAHYADEIITIADNCTDAAIARLQVDARKWHASKTAPKKYGDKIEQTHTGEVTVTSIERTIVSAPDSSGK